MVLFSPIDIWAASSCSEITASLVAVEGRVESLSKGESDWQSAKKKDRFCPEDQVQTLENSRGTLRLKNKMILKMDQKTIVRFSRTDKLSLLEMIMGRGFFFDLFPRSLTIETPFVNANVDGTEFVIAVDPDRQTTTITVMEGKVTAMNDAGSVTLTKNSVAVAKSGEAPTRFTVNPKDAVAWAFYYPQILNLRELQIDITNQDEHSWQMRMRRSSFYAQSGNLQKAFSEIAGLNEISDSQFYIYRASLLLSVGRVKEAQSDLEKVFQMSPQNGLALSLQAIIAVSQDDKKQAMQWATDAVTAAPNLASPKIALSYAHQANFNLPLALKATQEAQMLDPKSALVSARLAELWMSIGETDKGLYAAKKSVALNPDLSRGETILGFAYLTQINVDEAKRAFEKAIALDQSDPLARLGLGLAMIRKGDLVGGREQIEVAVGLDPNNALIRSYLGKSYYDEKKNPLAKEQFEISKRLDPKDPTPFFYDAILKQSENRPVEALRDLQTSIELNDNRAVYRSRLLLDEDLASRSVSMAGVYNDLGFQQLALNEGFKSLSTDPTNYSAHRFLADSYAAMPRSEIGRVSELLQSQLLQPLNGNPVQPRLGESGAGILSGTGPGDISMSEFNSLFMRDGVHLLVSGVGGANSTLGEEVILSGLSGRYSYSLGQFHLKTDGFRENNDRDQTIYNAFVHVSLTPNATIQAEVRLEDTETGDLPLRFDPAKFASTERNSIDAKTYRVGFHYRSTPRSDFVASFFYQDRGHGFIRSEAGIKADIKDEIGGFSGEAQHLFRVDPFSLVTGGGHFDGENTRNGSVELAFLGLPPESFKEDVNSRHTHLYTYAHIHLSSNATMTLGGSGDRFDGLPKDKEQFNPKFGLTWKMSPSTTLRIASFRVLKRPLVSNQTIEPTEVAGFQQFFDDDNGADSMRKGIALERQFSHSLFGGVELSKRKIIIPFTTLIPDEEPEVHVDERLNRIYLYWAFLQQVFASAEYQVEKFDSDNITISSAKKIKTERVPLSLHFFYPGGLFVKFKTTHIAQEGLFEGSLSPFDFGKDQFWLFDASIGYRLPNQRGMFTIEAKNLLDESFQFHETDIANPLIQPKRLIFAKLTLLF